VPISANDWFGRADVSTTECGDVRIEWGDGVRGGASPGETEAGGLDELAGDRDGGEATELRKDRTEGGEECWSTSVVRLSSMEGRSIGPSPVGNVPASGHVIVTLVLGSNSLHSCGGETGTEVTSVGEYMLGEDIRVELRATDPSRRSR